MVLIEAPVETTIGLHTSAVNLLEACPKEEHFLNILDSTHRGQALQHLCDGEVIAVECLGPFGFMVAVELKGSLKEAEDQVDKLGEIKERKMSDQPAPFFVPESALDKIIDYRVMTRNGVFKPEEIQKSLKHAMVNSGAFFQVALRSPFDKMMPYVQPTSVINEDSQREVKTGVVACLDQSYPALADIVKRLWEEDRIAMITSANLSGKQSTLTTAEDVWQTFGKKFPDLVVVDNPLLKTRLNELGFEQCSYTLALFADNSIVDEGLVSFLRQGNVATELIVELLNQPLDRVIFRAGTPSVVLTESPRFRSPADYDILRGVLR